MRRVFPHLALLLTLLTLQSTAQVGQGVQDPAWAPNGRQIAVSYLDTIWTMTPEGRQAKALLDGPAGVQEHAEGAKNGCPVSKALAGVEIRLNARLLQASNA